MKHTYPSLLRRGARRGLLLLGLAGLLPVAQAQVSFSSPALYATGGNSQGIVTADFNGDGRPDLATANSPSNSVSVLLQSGTTVGTFLPPATYSSGGGFNTTLTVGDLNGDGRPDLATINQSSGTVGVLLNSATTPGTFAPVATYGTGGNDSRGIAIADMNGDGRLDLVVANSTTVGVLLNSATTPGTFGTVTTYSGGSAALDELMVGDLNGDGRPDVVVASRTGTTVSVLLNSATTPGTLGTASTYTVGNSTYLRGVALGDLNNDGRLDIAVSNYDSQTISVLLNSATTPGTFPLTVSYSTGSTQRPYGVTIGDLNGDGLADIVASNYDGNPGTTVSVLVNSPTTPGTFPGTPTVLATGGTGPIHAVIRDMNADSRPDLAVSNFISNNVGVLLNTTVFATPTITSFSPTTGPVGTQVTITGTNLTGATAVRFNGTAASSFVVNSATSITAVVAAGTTTGLVTVTTPSGTATSATNFVVRVAPTTVADSYTTPQNVTLTGNVLTNDIGTNPRAILIIRPTHGTLALNPDGTFTYVPAAGYTGPDSFMYYACDPDAPLLCGNPVTVSITVLRVAPVTVADSYTTPQNTTLTGNVLSNDLGTAPIAILIIRPTHGTLLLNPDGTFTYQPTAGYVGPDSFLYYACDPSLPLLCGNPATVSITVVRVAPITVADSYATPQNTTLTGNVLSNDIGTNPQAILIIRPTHGSLLLNPNGTFTYQPTAGYTGSDSFIYYACNMGTPLVCGDPATVSITVTPTATLTATTKSATTSTARGTATTAGPAATQELALTGHPNPFSDELRLSFALPTAQAYTLALYDGQGRLVQQLASGQTEAGQAQELTVPTAAYATGLYLVRLTTATGAQLLKLLKQ